MPHLTLAVRLCELTQPCGASYSLRSVGGARQTRSQPERRRVDALNCSVVGRPPPGLSLSLLSAAAPRDPTCNTSLFLPVQPRWRRAALRVASASRALIAADPPMRL